jgi:PAS domain S-box-containing protein
MEASRTRDPVPMTEQAGSSAGDTVAAGMSRSAPRRLSHPVTGPLFAAVAVGAIEIFAPAPEYELAFTPLLFLLIAFAAFEGGFISGVGAAAIVAGHALLSYLDRGSPAELDTLVQLVAILLSAPALALLVGGLKQRASLFLTERARRAEAEARLAKQEVDEVYRRLVDGSPEGVAVHDGTRLLYMNRTGARMLGVEDPALLVGRRLRELVVSVAQDGRPGEPRATRLRRLTGGILDAEFLEQPITFGERQATQVVVRDVTERRATENRLAVAHAVSRILAEADSFEEAAPLVLEAFCTSFGWRKAGFWVIDPREQVLTLAGAWFVPVQGLSRFYEFSRAQRFRPGQGLPGRVWQELAPVWIPEVSAEPWFMRAELASAEGLRSAYAFPILAGDEFLAVMEFFDTESVRPPAAMVEMLGSIGREIGVFVRKARAEAELRRSTSQLQALLRSAGEAITAQDPQGRIVFANDAAAHAWGFPDAAALLAAPPAEILDRFELLQADGTPLAPSELPGSLALAGQESPRRTLRFRSLWSGEERWSLVQATPVYADDGSVQLAISVFSDVTEIMRYQTALEAANVRYEGLTRELEATVTELRARTEDSEAARRQLRERASELRLLADASRVLGASLDYESTLQTVADLAVERLADGCIIYLGSPDSGFRGVASAHADPARVSAISLLCRGYVPKLADPHDLLARVLVTGKPALLSAITPAMVRDWRVPTAFAEAFAELAPVSGLVVPLSARNRVLGAVVLGLGAGATRRYDDAALRLVEELAARAAVAVDNALLYRAADEERRRAERAAEHTARLQGVTAELSRAITPGEVARVILEQGLAALRAHAGSVYLIRKSGEREALALVRAIGYSPGILERYERIDLDAPLPLAEAARTGEAIFIPNERDAIERYPALGAEQLKSSGAWAALPLVAQETMLGAIGLSFPERIDFSNAERNFMRALARQCAQALERARLFEAERSARSAAEEAEQRLALISEASGALAVSLDLGGIATQLTRLVTASGMADICCLHLLAEDGARTDIAVEGPQEEEQAARELLHAALNDNSGSPIERVVRTGQPLLVPVIRAGDRLVEGIAATRVEELLTLGVRSMLAVPLLARGRRVGAMLLLSRSPRRRYDAEDLSLSLELARRAALAVDNARLYWEAQEANRAKADFLAVMSHELRTPLNAVIGYTDLLASGVSGEISVQQERQLARIKASAMHLLELIEEVLTFARTEAGREEVRMGDVDLRRVAQEAISLIEPQAADKGLAVRLTLPDEPAVAVTDSGKVRQILANLMSNAVKFTSSGEVCLTVRPPTDGRILIDVQDTGVGIDPVHQPRVFEPFWQVEQGTTRHVGGSGLGLAVVLRLARLLGGDVSLVSTPGSGSTFTLELPIRPRNHTAVEPLPSTSA